MVEVAILQFFILEKNPRNHTNPDARKLRLKRLTTVDRKVPL